MSVGEIDFPRKANTVDSITEQVNKNTHKVEVVCGGLHWCVECMVVLSMLETWDKWGVGFCN